MSEGASILVGCLGNVAWVKVNGKATHDNAGSLKQFLQGRLEKGCRQFVIDLEDCNGIDSTFIGILYRTAAGLAEIGEEGQLQVINPGERNHRSISKLGLDHLIKIDGSGEGWQRERELVKQNLGNPINEEPLEKCDHTQMILDAHEALIAANEENRNRFCDVVEFLRQDLEAQTADN
ncbi:MAG: STAS domain-containing protein [Verrucomicrobiales bacterium]